MQYLVMALLTILIVAADQFTKYLTVANIPLHGFAEAIPGLFHLTYAQNTGAAWSSFEGMIWLFALIFAGFATFIIWEFPKDPMPRTKEWGYWYIVSIKTPQAHCLLPKTRMPNYSLQNNFSYTPLKESILQLFGVTFKRIVEQSLAISDETPMTA